jgi:hypothetical protein
VVESACGFVVIYGEDMSWSDLAQQAISGLGFMTCFYGLTVAWVENTSYVIPPTEKVYKFMRSHADRGSLAPEFGYMLPSLAPILVAER